MFAKVVIASLAMSSILALPVDPPSDVPQTPIPIVSQTNDVNGNGNFTFTYETGNGIKLQQEGFVKPIPPGNIQAAEDGEEVPTEIQVLSGSYAYTAPDGTVVQLQYTADENGFHPEGSHLPTAPPVPSEIQSQLNLSSAVTSVILK